MTHVLSALFCKPFFRFIVLFSTLASVRGGICIIQWYISQFRHGGIEIAFNANFASVRVRWEG